MSRIIWPDGGGFIYLDESGHVQRIIQKPKERVVCAYPSCNMTFVPYVVNCRTGQLKEHHSTQCASLNASRMKEKTKR